MGRFVQSIWACAFDVGCVFVFCLGWGLLPLGIAGEDTTTPAAVIADSPSTPANQPGNTAFSGTVLPAPPAQTAPWTYSGTKFQEPFVSAVRTLYEQGLADPRGCAYRTVTVAVGNCWNGGGTPVKTHAWVLPRGTASRDFAVCWNGLVYPVLTVGEPADFRADVLAALAADEKARAEYAEQNKESGSSYMRRYGVEPEERGVASDKLKEMLVCPLLRLGEEELADRVRKACRLADDSVPLSASVEDSELVKKDPYLLLADMWLWSLFDRAVCAHMRADDDLARLTLRQLLPAWASAEKAAAARGFHPPQDVNEDKAIPYFSELEPARELLTDQERRLRLRQQSAVSAMFDVPRLKALSTASGTAPVPYQDDQPSRIKRLIAALEQIDARQDGQPGGVSLGNDERIAALVREGDPAVDPLIACLEKDPRLTRSVHFHRDFFPHRSVIRVSEAAYVALANILQVSFFGAASTGDDLSAREEEERQRLAQAIREYWSKYRDLSLPERWYLSLADDHADPRQWFEAAGNIIQPADAEQLRGSMFGGGWITMSTRAQGEQPPMCGEILRAKQNPSVSELLARRTVDYTPKNFGVPNAEREMQDACAFALILYKWDLPASLPVMAEQCDRIYSYHASNGFSRSCGTTDFMTVAYVQMSLRLAKSGDYTALDRYGKLLPNVAAHNNSFEIAELLSPLWLYPDRAALQAAAEQIFGGNSEAWNLASQSNYLSALELLRTPLLAVPAFQKQLILQLQNKQVIGEIKVEQPHGVSTNITIIGRSFGSASTGNTADPRWPKQEMTAPLRVCDRYARELSLLANIPAFELFWPEQERDKQCAAMVDFLRKFGRNYLPAAGDKTRVTLYDRPELKFPLLDHPATKADVEAGRALFTLQGEGEARVVKNLTLPFQATWTSCKSFPVYRNRFNPETEQVEQFVDYDNRGMIWQAEEVFQDGKWRRYYGFAGRVVARVPAEEIAIPQPNAE